jgi:hypothetical protein
MHNLEFSYLFNVVLRKILKIKIKVAKYFILKFIYMKKKLSKKTYSPLFKVMLLAI